MTRYELAMIVARAYAKMEEKMESGGNVTIDEEAIMNDLMDEFGPELDEIRDLVKANRLKIEDLERKLQDNSKKDSELADKLAKLGSKFNFKGHMKLRWDGKYYDPGNTRFQRPRISFRFDMSAPVNDEVTFKGRLGTGNVGTRQGSEITLTDVAGIKPINLERAYLVWEPEAWDNWTIMCGKFPPNWATSTQFIDSDVNFEGLGWTYEESDWVINLAQLTPADKGGYIVAQVGATDLLMENFDAYVTYHFLSAGAFETMFTAYPYWYRLDADDYAAIEALARYSFDFDNWPIFLEAAYRQNLADELAGMPSGLQQAATAKIKVNKIKEVGDWDAYVFWLRWLPNSMIPQWVNIAAGWGGCDGQIFGGGFGYKLQDHVLFRFNYYNNENLVTNPSGGWDYIFIDIITDF
jgi:hypothetical protein